MFCGRQHAIACLVAFLHGFASPRARACLAPQLQEEACESSQAVEEEPSLFEAAGRSSGCVARRTPRQCDAPEAYDARLVEVPMWDGAGEQTQLVHGLWYPFHHLPLECGRTTRQIQIQSAEGGQDGGGQSEDEVQSQRNASPQPVCRIAAEGYPMEAGNTSYALGKGRLGGAHLGEEHHCGASWERFISGPEMETD